MPGVSLEVTGLSADFLCFGLCFADFHFSFASVPQQTLAPILVAVPVSLLVSAHQGPASIYHQWFSFLHETFPIYP
jgi:hypothetical protein